MKKLLILLLFAFLSVSIVRAISFLHLYPKDECDLSRPIKRSPFMIPAIGIDKNKLYRLRSADRQTYKIEILQDNRVVYSSVWNANYEELILPSYLEGEYNIVFSAGINVYIGTIGIDYGL